MKAVICAIAKFEYNYIKEWVDYHLKLGFDKIVIYDNNDPDGEKYDELLSEFIAKKQVELRDVRGQRAVQRVVYNEFYQNDKFDWVAFIDIDEFITPNRTKYKTIKEFIEKNSDAEAIFLYWQTYGDSGKTYPTKSTKPVSILKQYNIPANKYSLIDQAFRRQNAWGKSIIKKGLPVKYLHEHFIVDPINIKYVDSTGNPANVFDMTVDENYVENTYKDCYVKHLYTKSLYEYIDCKVRRPAANSMNLMHFPSKYFKVNEINEEKRKYLESIGYKMEFVFRPDTLCIVEISNLDEYYALEPYIMNIISLCSCRLILRIMSNADDVYTIHSELDPYFNENIIYLNNEGNKLFNIKYIYDDLYDFLKYTVNCVIHMNIPYGVEIDNYVKEYIDPIFNANRLTQSLERVLNGNNALCVTEGAITNIDKKSDSFKKYKKLIKGELKKREFDIVAQTGNFITKYDTLIKYKKEFKELEQQFIEDPELLLYFITHIHNEFVWCRNIQ